MTDEELIDRLTDITKGQAEIIKELHEIIKQNDIKIMGTPNLQTERRRGGA